VVVEAGFTPDGEQFAEDSGTGQPGNELVSRSFDAEAIETQLHDMLERQKAIAASKGEYFNPSEFMYSFLQQRSAWLFKWEIPDGVEIEEAEAQGHKMALALGILAYPQWRPENQLDFRDTLHTDGFIQYCEEAQLMWQQRGFIDWEREDPHDHYIKLPETGRQLLKCITHVVGIQYNPQQDTFYFSTVLNQPEPVVPGEQ